METANIGALAAGTKSSTGLIGIPEAYSTVCAWCRRTKGEDGSWAFSPANAHGAVTHGICPACLSRMFSELHVYSAKAHSTAR